MAQQPFKYPTRTWTQADYDLAQANSDWQYGGTGPGNYEVGTKVPETVYTKGGRQFVRLQDGTEMDYTQYMTDLLKGREGELGPEGYWGLAAAALGGAAFAGAGAAGAAGELGAGAAGAGELGAAGIGDFAGAGLASDAGFVPGAFDLGASGYGGTGAQGLLTAGAEGSNAWGGISNALTSTPPGSGTSLTRMLGLSGDSADLVDVGGKLGGTFLGLLGSNAQGDAYRDVANQYMALGAGDRARLDASYKPGFDIWKQPGYGDLLSGVTDTQLRRLSASGGNPFGNPGGLTEMNKNITQNVGIPALAGYRGQLLQGGGVGLNAASSASLMEAGTARSPYDALGAGLGMLTTPKDNTLEELLKRMQAQQPIRPNTSGVT